jgi:hypothetical protein
MDDKADDLEVLRAELIWALDRLIDFYTYRPAETPTFSLDAENMPEPGSAEADRAFAEMKERSRRSFEEAEELVRAKKRALDLAALTILRLRRHPETAAGALKAAREFATYRLREASGPDRSTVKNALLPWMAAGFKDMIKSLTSIQGLSEQQLEEKGEALLQEQVASAQSHMEGMSKLFELKRKAQDDLNAQLLAILEACRSAALSTSEPPDTLTPSKHRMAVEMLVGRLEEVAEAYLASPERQEEPAFPISAPGADLSDSLAHARRMLKSIREQQKSPQANLATRSGRSELAITGALGEAYVWLAEAAPAAPSQAVERTAAALANIGAERDGLGAGGFFGRGFWSGDDEPADELSPSEETGDELVARLQARWKSNREDWRSLEVQQRLRTFEAVTAAIEASRGLLAEEPTRVLN